MAEKTKRASKLKASQKAARKLKDSKPVPSKSKIMRILRSSAGLKDLSPNMVKTRLASLSQNSVKNMLRLSGLGGAALATATTLAVGELKKLPRGSKEKKGPMRLSSREPTDKKMTDKEKIADLEQKLDIANTVGKVQDERAKAKDKSLADSVRENTNTRRGTNMKVPPNRVSKDVPGVKKSLRPKARPKSNAPKTSLRPKLRPKEKMMGGGMATKKKPTGYMYGGMAKKPKAKK